LRFKQEEMALVFSHQGETVRIEAWGKDSLRIRAARRRTFAENNWALTEEVRNNSSKVIIVINDNDTASIANGRISVEINEVGVLSFYRDGKRILRDYYRNNAGTISRESRCLKVVARDYKPIIGGEYTLTMRFEGNDGEKLYGMGQYQHPYLDLKGCALELAQRNSQTSIPFVLSSMGYGFLWNNPAVGNAFFGKNFMEWTARVSKQFDYWITVGDDPRSIVENYTAETGRAPIMSSELLGLWQCKLRYRTQEEVLSVARRYKEMGIPLDVIVIDFFHWTRQGDWCFDRTYWPDPKAMTEELHAMGTKVMVSVWPTVDRKSMYFTELYERGLLIRAERGAIETYDYEGDCLILDVTNPEAREFIWEKCKESYYDYGIDMFWLDNSEPELAVYDYDNYRYSIGTMLEVGNSYPLFYTKAFADGILEHDSQWDLFHLVRCGWVGSQKYAALLWSGDIPSTFEALEDQLAAGLNIGMAGIPWWTTDIGGFMTENVNDPEFLELLLRWYEFAVFSPILRMHGDRGPHNIPALSNQAWGGGYLHTGHSNELWSYGEEAMKIMVSQLELRLSLKPYLEKLMMEAHETGAPLMRTMFFEFPKEEACWEISDQYMFGDQYLVAPVLKAGQRERKVYLPSGCWENIYDHQVYEGPVSINCDAPLERIPVFIRC
jgi:alpha-D-xyloside xylohydrolase